jgi:DNA repair protein RadC
MSPSPTPHRYRIPLHTVSLVRERMITSEDRTVTTSAVAAAVIRAIIGHTDREQFIVLCLDTKNRIISASIVSIGSLSLSIVHPRECFKTAILQNAAAVIFGHNHPSGDPEPSPEDGQLTRRLVQAGEIIGIRVLDHVIVGDGTDRSYSFADAGHLKGD